jgi:hypothetical protein
MDRTLRVEVDRDSWPKKGPPNYPSSFPGLAATNETFNIPSILLTIGYLTTPTHSSGVSLSEFWAWVRYLHAIADTDDMRLTQGFWGLDAHQKTILSDDFGMGVPMVWLMEKLSIGTVCDGRYFIERLAAKTGAVALKTAKRGPNKSPDFVMRDTDGIWHVIECKGTQSGVAYRNHQLGNGGGAPTGARLQKRTIVFPSGYTGQRLASALAIDVQNGKNQSVLKIVDPPAEEEDFEVGQGQIDLAADTVLRATAARALRLAGYGATSASVSSPDGSGPASRPLTGRAENRRREFIDEREKRAQEELADQSDRETFQADGEKFVGREVVMDLPAPIRIGDGSIRRLRLRHGVRKHALAEMRHGATITEPLQQSDASWRETFGKAQVEQHGRSARLSLGRFFVSELKLLE